MGWLERASDMTVEELLAVKDHDPDGPPILFEFATQLPPTLKLTDTCQPKTMTYRASSNRHAECGSRLATWKRGFTIQDPCLTRPLRQKGCYKLHFDDDGNWKVLVTSLVQL